LAEARITADRKAAKDEADRLELAQREAKRQADIAEAARLESIRTAALWKK